MASALPLAVHVVVGAGFAVAAALGLAVVLVNFALAQDLATQAPVTQDLVTQDLVTQELAKGGGWYKVGPPYEIRGRRYEPGANPHYSEIGIGSWYGREFHGRTTANGERYNMNALSAAHPTLPLPSYVRVTNLENGRVLIVRVNDRGPFIGERILDLSRFAARQLGFERQGRAQIQVDYIGPAPLDGNDVLERAHLASQSFAKPTSISKPAMANAAPSRAPNSGAQAENPSAAAPSSAGANATEAATAVVASLALPIEHKKLDGLARLPAKPVKPRVLKRKRTAQSPARQGDTPTDEESPGEKAADGNWNCKANAQAYCD